MKNIALFIFLAAGINCYPQNDTCFGEKRELKIGQTMPYTKVRVGGAEGYFLLDFGTTSSTIDPDNFINGKPVPLPSGNNQFSDFDFFGRWGTVRLNVQDHSNIHLDGFSQAGILGTDFLSRNIFTIDYEEGVLYRSDNDNFCTDDQLKMLGFKATSTAGYYSHDYTKLNNACVTNVPTIPIKIGNIGAIAQVDPGFDDYIHRHAININQALYRALSDAGIILVENPSANTVLSTCIPNVTEQVKAYKLPEGTSFSITGIDGNPILVKSDVNIFLKLPPIEAMGCDGIGTWQIPAAQLGASFLLDSKKVVFDPFGSRVWFFTNQT